ncbi:MAG TPA: hypothetical protein VFR86_05855 [Burkholderiaceae bacterium]|nr:hypothetical protein [Burkholderiaceae bacterium]
MRAAFDWSHDLLSADDKTVFRRLGVFAGSFTLEAARAVVADQTLDKWTVVDALADLVDVSLAVVGGNVVLVEKGDLSEAAVVAREALALLRGEWAWMLYDALALHLALVGAHEYAARLGGFVNASYAAASRVRDPNEQRLHQRLLVTLRHKVGHETLDRLLAMGAQLSEEEARKIAL